MLTIQDKREIETICLRVARKVAKDIAVEQAKNVVDNRLKFRGKIDKANSRSAYEIPNQSGNAPTVTGSVSNSGGPTAALISLLNGLNAAGIIVNNSTA